MTSRFIVVEGIDQSGKKTQALLLVRKLRQSGFRTATLTFPMYGSFAGREIRAFLDGRRELPFEAVQMLYSLNRWENLETIKKKLSESDFLIADRYTGSNLAYGMARGLDLKWLARLDQGLPFPDVVILLDVPVPASFSRKGVNRDVQESDRTLLSKVRKNYLELARRFRWRVVKGIGPPHKVHGEVWKAVRNLTRNGQK